ncbi:ABC-F family ATP-binding cassette domain-containing protein [Breoghania sp. L-A4]|uniref:ABC-F family ATP-binding cassette domain-containing protein n=1 Tax=Breoghania sp. L-A4 TaxID=2304600 RepID=UPI000E35F598|nr:ABC-F family ATP-binding cassette domain-containing protein [Breoghania sp. L-A4]AXS40610.1 ABC transporter ATP-binding protein [Breoghania sp. L-A4]
MLHVNELTYRIAGRTLLDQASVVVPEGAKVGLVGRNGTGKSTLFGLITGDLSPESGSLTVRRNARVGQVAQEAPGSDISLIDVVLAADTERSALLAEAETATDPHRIGEIHMRLADIDSHTAEARAGSILHGLGFSAAAQQQPCSAFSGGWRMRVALAAVLFSEPDLLLLDEPTNYLDLEGTLWLETYIARYPYTVLLISHDRDLLNKAVDTIVHLDQLKLTSYRGGYDNFERQRRENMAVQEKHREKQETQRKHMEAFVNRFRAKASKARQAQSRLKMLERMEPIQAAANDMRQPISFPEPKVVPAPPLIALEGASVGYDGKPVLKNLNLRLDPDDRIALLGANGNGKSTFAKLLAGRLELISGHMARANKMKIAYFAQHQLDELVPEHSPVQHVRARMPGEPEGKVRGRVARFGLPTDRMETAAKDLSGGEKARLLLGLATFDGPNLLILDEPTNHLDIDSREALVFALNDYQGAVILISHDRHLVEASADRLWLVADGTVTNYDGDMEEYRKMILQGGKGADRAGEMDKQQRGSAQDRRRGAAEKRAQLAPLRKQIQAAERKVEKLQGDIKRFDRLLADPELYARDPLKATQLAKRKADTEKALARAEEDWLGMTSQYEEATAAE